MLTTYTDEIAHWRQGKDDALRAEDGWLTLVGLFWLHEGINTVGSDPAADVILPAAVPARVGEIELSAGQVWLHVEPDSGVLVDDAKQTEIVLRPDTHEDGAALVTVGTVTFFVIRRGDQLGVRVRDFSSPDRAAFTGRHWFPIDPAYRLEAVFTPHSEPRTLQIMNVVGMIEPMENIGTVEFTLHNQTLRLEAFPTSTGALWLIFKDATSGDSTYGACRYLTAERSGDTAVDLDFNKALHPPCAFTDYATCALPPRENVLSVAVEAGERL